MWQIELLLLQILLRGTPTRERKRQPGIMEPPIHADERRFKKMYGGWFEGVVLHSLEPHRLSI
jgi:hypothetical protein